MVGGAVILLVLPHPHVSLVNHDKGRKEDLFRMKG